MSTLVLRLIGRHLVGYKRQSGDLTTLYLISRRDVCHQKFAQAHVDGLKNLPSAFTTLYDAMPDAQKKNADRVLQTSGHRPAASHS